MEDSARSEGGEKRPVVEGGDDGGVSAVKRRRKNGEDEIRRVAEIVLVLSAMGRMRGGRDLTMAEKTMMAEAREKVVALCEELAPKDILPSEAFGGVIEDLGLNRLKEQRLGFRPPKISISDKIALTKRRMEESKAFAAQPAPYPLQRSQTGSGASVENRGTPPTVRVFSSDKVAHTPVSTGAFQPPTPVVHVSAAASMPMRFHPPGTEVRPPVISTSVPNNIGKDSTSVVPPRVDRAHLRRDGRPNGPSLPHIPVSSAANQQVVRTTPPVHLQPQPHPQPQVNVGKKNNAPDQLPLRTNRNTSLSAPQMTAQAVGQTPRPFVSQTAPGTLPTMHPPVQGMQFVHAPPLVNHHLEISKLVQKLLNPKLPQHPAWTPPSRDYMNRAIPCQFCKLIINEVENMVVCDACEKGFHLGCLQSYNAKSIPRGEWHCPRCLAMSHGKPFPPKYGRVTRNINAPKVPSKIVGVQLPAEKKAEGVDEKVNQPNAITNGNPDSEAHSQAVKVAEPLSGSNMPHGSKISKNDTSIGIKKDDGPKVAEPSSESNLKQGSEVDRNDMSIGIKKDDEPNLDKCPNNATVAAIQASLSPPTASSSDKPAQQVVKSEVPSSEDRLISEAEPITPVIPQANNKSDDLPTSSNQNDVDQKVSGGVEVPVYQGGDGNGVIESSRCYDDKSCEKDAAQQTLLDTPRGHNQAGELAEALENGLHNVDWIGDVDRLVNEKKFYRSCRINGVLYQVQDYALFRSGNGKLVPLKLQAMWEDSQTSSKWLVVHKCYFPDDLPEEVGRPGAPQSNEVYESTHDSNVMAGFIQGPCEVLPFRKFGEETERSDQGSQANDRTQPVFIRNWFYDESRRAFCPNAS